MFQQESIDACKVTIGSHDKQVHDTHSQFDSKSDVYNYFITFNYNYHHYILRIPCPHTPFADMLIIMALPLWAIN